MGDFRKVVYVLAALVLFAGLASAQITCTANAVPTNVRSEGRTELVGDIELRCSGTSGVIGQINFQIFTTAPITSRVNSSSDNTSESLLLVNEPSGATNASNPCSGTATCAAGSQAVIQGKVAGNSVTFFGVPIYPPGTTGGGSANQTVYRFTNIRVNANAIGGGGAVANPVLAQLTVSATSSFSLLNNNTFIVAYVQPGLGSDTRVQGGTSSSGAIGSPQIQSQCATNLTTINSASSLVYLHFVENFGTAFKVRSSNVSISTLTNYGVVPTNANILPPTGATNNTESGFVVPNLAVAGVAAGYADFGTRLKAVFNNIPAGVTITVSRSASSGSSSGVAAELVPSESSILTGAFTNVTTSTVVALTAVNGQATAVWEVLQSTLSLDTFNFQVWSSFTASPGTNSPAPGIATVNLSYAPTETGTAAATTGPIPRFTDTSTAKQFLNIAICRTVLLFPFVTNQAGFDTGLAIANSSTDPFGTTPQSGSCQLNAYGANAPTTAITSASVASGTVYTALASTSLPGFQGYVIAICNFQYAHGFAFVSDLGARNLAMGYLALIIPDPATGSRAASSGTDDKNSEILSQ